MTEENQVKEEHLQQKQQETPVIEEKQNDKEFNFVQVRKQLKERDEYIRQLQQDMETIKRQIQKPESPEEEIEDDDFITKKHLQKNAKKIAQEEVNNALKAYEQSNYKSRARETYSDYDSVVTEDSLTRLESEMPEIAKIISEAKDKYQMACGAYKAIKSLNKSTSIEKEIKQNKEAMEKNLKEPLSSAAVDRRPIATAAKMTDSDYRKLWEEMQYYASKA